MSIEVYDTEGNVVARTHAYVRKLASKEPVIAVSISRTSDGGGFLAMAFQNGYKAEMPWACMSILKSKLRTWKSLYGAPLAIEYEDAGEVSFDNPLLK